jgi:peptidoglycan/xylan/chitin deacetylase (PgdA/CDA1 family)
MLTTQADGDCSSAAQGPKFFAALLYHAVDEFPKHTHVAIDRFRRQMAWLKAEGFTVEGFDGLETRLRARRWPEKYVALTFDDGHISLFDVAETLAQYGFGATAFIITGVAKRGDKDHLGPKGVAEIAAHLDIGSHSVTHSFLTQAPPARTASELRESKLWLEDLLGRPVTSFSAPGGYLNNQVVELALSTGYSLLGNSVEWPNNSDRLALRRIVNRVEVRRDDTPAKFEMLANRDQKVFLQKYCRSQIVLGLKSFLPFERVLQLGRFYRKLESSSGKSSTGE